MLGVTGAGEGECACGPALQLEPLRQAGEPSAGVDDAQRGLGVVVDDERVERSPQVVPFGGERLGGGPTVGRGQRHSRRLGDRQVVGGVPVARLGVGAAGRELVLGELAERLQQRVAR